MLKWTPAQELAVKTLDQSLGVVAGAGSGKTKVLIGRLMEILQNKKADFSQLVAITFTNKAASEMTERLREEIEKRIAAGDPAGYWRELKEALPSAQISTIHSLCARLLREHPQAANIDPLFSVLADDEGTLLLEEAATSSLLELAAESKPLVRLLANYGKERVLENLFAFYNRLRADGRAVGEVWASSQAEIKRRRPALLEAAAAANQLGADLLTAPATTAGQKAALAAFAESWRKTAPVRASLLAGNYDLDLKQLLEFLCCGNKIDARGKLAEPVKGLRAALDSLAAEVSEQRSAPFIRDFCLLLERADQSYAQRKRELGALDFSDLELSACKLLQAHPDIAREYRRKIKYLLVDEYQDTSRLQEKILRSLHVPGENNLFVVGDPKQSIYRFRGAEVAVFGETVERITAEGGRKIELLDNFRTSKTLIALFNQLFAQLLNGKIEYQPLLGHRESSLQPELLLAYPQEDVDSEAKREEEARVLAARIKNMVEKERPVIEAKSGPRPVRWGDIAFLFRSATNLPVYQEALAAAGIPNYVVGGSGYYAKQEVQDVLNFLRWLDNPKDQVALTGILRSPFFSVSDQALFWLTRAGGIDSSLWAELPKEITGQDREAVEWARALLRELLSLRTLPLAQLIGRILDRTGYKIAILGDFFGKQKLQNLEKLIQLAERYSREGLVTPSQFIARVDSLLARKIKEGEAQLESEEDDTVKLLTIHKSKGLEYPVVVIPDFSRQLRFGSSNFFAYGAGQVALHCGEMDVKPSRMAELAQQEMDAELEESKRVLYVAMTRARDQLILSGCAVNPKPGGIAQQNSWLGWLGALFEVSDWQTAAAAPLQYQGGCLNVVIRSEGTAPLKREQGHTLEETSESLPLLFEAKTKPSEINPTHPPLTATGLITYADCPRRYFYAYRWRIDESLFGLLEADGIGLPGWQKGQILHRACERLHPDSDAQAVLRESFAAYRIEPTAALLRELTPLVECYQKNELCSRLQTALSEWQFAVGLGPFVLEGFVDKLLPGAVPALVDYKSNLVTSDALPELTAYYKLQLEVYAHAVHQRLGCHEAELVIHYLVPNRTVSWRIDNWHDLEEKLLLLSQGLVSKEYEEEFPCNSQSCHRCRFGKHLCPEGLSGQVISDKIKTG